MKKFLVIFAVFMIFGIKAIAETPIPMVIPSEEGIEAEIDNQPETFWSKTFKRREIRPQIFLGQTNGQTFLYAVGKAPKKGVELPFSIKGIPQKLLDECKEGLEEMASYNAAMQDSFSQLEKYVGKKVYAKKVNPNLSVLPRPYCDDDFCYVIAKVPSPISMPEDLPDILKFDGFLLLIGIEQNKKPYIYSLGFQVVDKDPNKAIEKAHVKAEKSLCQFLGVKEILSFGRAAQSANYPVPKTAWVLGKVRAK